MSEKQKDKGSGMSENVNRTAENDAGRRGAIMDAMSQQAERQALDRAIEPYADQLKSAYGSVAKGVAMLLHFCKTLHEDPPGSVRYLAALYKLTGEHNNVGRSPEDIHRALQEGPGSRDINPMLKKLKIDLDELSKPEYNSMLKHAEELRKEGKSANATLSVAWERVQQERRANKGAGKGGRQQNPAEARREAVAMAVRAHRK